MLEKVAYRLAHEVDRLEHVDADRLRPTVVPDLVGPVERRLAEDPGVRDDDVDAPSLRDGLGEEGPRGTGRRHLRLQQKAPLWRQPRGRRLGALAVPAVMRDHRRTARTELGSGDRADAAGGAGDEDDAAL